MRQSGQDASCGGFECDGLALEVYTIDSFGSQGLEDYTNKANSRGSSVAGHPSKLAPSVGEADVTRFNRLEYFVTHAFLCCHCCAEILRPCECWGSHPRRPPRLKAQTDSVRLGWGFGQTLEHTTPLPRGPTESWPAAPCGPCTQTGCEIVGRAGQDHNGLISSSEWTEAERRR